LRQTDAIVAMARHALPLTAVAVLCAPCGHRRAWWRGARAIVDDDPPLRRDGGATAYF
jgi:hypothetical protein